jgi:chorismate mutase/prephenate dehydratase
VSVVTLKVGDEILVRTDEAGRHFGMRICEESRKGDMAARKKASGSLDLKKLRAEIDGIDDRILQLLNERAAISLAVGRAKADSVETVFKPFREKEVLDRLTRTNPGPLPENHLYAIYREIMSSSRRLHGPSAWSTSDPRAPSPISRAWSTWPLGRPHAQGQFRGGLPGRVRRRGRTRGHPLENSLQGTVGQW